jgi:hypothetical protein
MKGAIIGSRIDLLSATTSFTKSSSRSHLNFHPYELLPLPSFLPQTTAARPILAYCLLTRVTHACLSIRHSSTGTSGFSVSGTTTSSRPIRNSLLQHPREEYSLFGNGSTVSRDLAMQMPCPYGPGAL